jgi:hypothetical protein
MQKKKIKMFYEDYHSEEITNPVNSLSGKTFSGFGHMILLSAKKLKEQS